MMPVFISPAACVVMQRADHTSACLWTRALPGQGGTQDLPPSALLCYRWGQRNQQAQPQYSLTPSNPAQSHAITRTAPSSHNLPKATLSPTHASIRGTERCETSLRRLQKSL